ncbi:MAG TPA: hypothetical protein EYP79_02755 [Campylobacterales bacterium]|nr:hypothetical protein [Campylobacterales bacterium]
MKIFYEDTKELANYFDIDIKKLTLKEPFLLDGILALAVTKILFDKIDYDLINSFKIDHHKLEEFFDKNGRLWVDDSKATNIDASIKAVKRYRDKKIYLIAGGDSKGADLEPFIKFLKDFNIEIFAIGKDGKNIFDLSKKYSIKCRLSLTLQNSIKEIKKVLDKNSVALLSPGCASLDQFSSYKERGEVFKRLALEE